MSLPTKRKPRAPAKPKAPPLHPHVALAEAYVADVLAGRVLAGKWIRLACERHMRDMAAARVKDSEFCFDPEAAERFCRFAERFPHVKGRWAFKHELFIMQPWQCFANCSIFGWKRRKSGLRRFRKVREYLPRKNGKAIQIDTPVATPHGWKAHGQLRPGDFVFGPTGLPVKVLAAGPAYLGPCRVMEFSDGASIIAHDAHEWVTERTWYTGRKMVGFRWGQKQGPLPPVESQEIARTLRGGSRGDFVHRVPVSKALCLPEANLPMDPYVFGAWLGDGGSNGQGFTSEDDQIPGFIRAQGYACRRLKTKQHWSLSAGLGDGSFIRLLRSMGALGNKHIPECYLRASLTQREALLQGLMDTDGTVSKSGQATFCNTNRTLAEGFTELVRSLGMKAQWTEKRAMLDGRDCGERFDVQFWARPGINVARLPRKLARVKPSTGRAMSRTITGAAPCGQHSVNCITVEGGLYLVGKEMVTTHNSLGVAPIALYMFAADGEPGAEVYSGATNEKQAWEVFGPAKQMATLKPDFVRHYGIDVNAKSLTRVADMSKFEPVIGKPGDGSSPHCSITDEYHEHDTDAQLATMETGMGAREQPMSIVVSTAGDNLAGPCRDDWLECQKVLEGITEDNALFCLIFAADAEDDWTSEAALRKANPNYDISVSGEFLQAQQRDAINNPRKQGHFKTKHLNLWVQARDAFINMQRWAECKKPELKLEDFEGRRCRIGLDLASKIDLTALEILFEQDDGTFVRFGKYYLPEERVMMAENQHYQAWHTAGWLTATEGNMTDYFHILDDVKDLAAQFEIAEIAYDPFNATMLVTALQNEGLPMVEVGATVLNFSEPMKHIDGLIYDRKLFHNGDPVMEWAMSNVVAKLDRKDNIFPNKEKPENKIDPFVALCMAMARCLAAPDVQPSYQMLFL